MGLDNAGVSTYLLMMWFLLIAMAIITYFAFYTGNLLIFVISAFFLFFGILGAMTGWAEKQRRANLPKKTYRPPPASRTKHKDWPPFLIDD